MPWYAQLSKYVSPRITTLSATNAFTGVITILVSSAKETKDGSKIQIEQLPLKD
jgi:hypothetical protein